MNLYTKYQEIETELGKQTIRFTIFFNKELTSWATNQPTPIGYRVNAVPVKIREVNGFRMEESGAFTGFNDTLLPCDRQHPSRLKKAIDVLNYNLAKYLMYFQNGR